MDVIKCADYVIDLGPEGGDKGGNIVATGTPGRGGCLCGKLYGTIPAGETEPLVKQARVL